ncbi:hypothetical protein BDZ45DRAFT_674875 [Acephala macrosclerotiorum]|nr:hypothetical protein BDZ45DRAFT_674875 [Acephala macrosclerotiorum]
MTLSHDGRYTATSMARLAWAVLISSHTRNEDVVFSTLAAGRNVPLEGISEINSPTMAIVPFRWVLRLNNTIKEELERIQEQSNSMIPFEQTGLHSIAQMREDHALACRF